MVNLEHVAPTGQPQQGARYLLSGKPGVVAVLEGGLGKPHVLGTIRTQSGTAKQLRLFIAEARRSAGNDEREAVHMPVMQTSTAIRRRTSAPGDHVTRRTVLIVPPDPAARGMLLSQLIEEKSNKVIEGPGGRGPGRRHLPRQTARHARGLARGHRGLVVRRRRRDGRLCARRA
jgi:hypothetical protein